MYPYLWSQYWNRKILKKDTFEKNVYQGPDSTYITCTYNSRFTTFRGKTGATGTSDIGRMGSLDIWNLCYCKLQKKKKCWKYFFLNSLILSDEIFRSYSFFYFKSVCVFFYSFSLILFYDFLKNKNVLIYRTHRYLKNIILVKRKLKI